MLADHDVSERTVAMAGTPAAAVSLSRRTWAALIAGFALVILLLTLTAVTLISQRQRTVLLNQQLGTLVHEATLALHGAAPLLGAVPARSSTVKSRASSLAQLVSDTGPLVRQLRATGFPATISAVGQSAASLKGELPAASTLIVELQALATATQRLQLLPRASAGLSDLAELVRLQTRALSVSRATLGTGRDTRGIARQTLAAVERVLATAQQTLTVANQTLAHAANLDRKVGPVP